MSRRLRFLTLTILVLSLFTGALAQTRTRRSNSIQRRRTGTAANGSQKVQASEYVPVHAYDPARNAADDIRAAIAEAGRTGKRVLVEVGGEWCIWCHIMDAYFEKNPELLAFREKNFIMVKINFSEENKNEPLLSRYPQINGYPHLFVLERDGHFLHSQDTGKLEEGKSYNLTKFMDFLKEWAPPEKGSASH